MSLLNLGRVVGYNAKLFILLNIPTVTIIQEKAAAEEASLPDSSLAQKLMLYWKKMKGTAIDKDKFSELDRALRDSGKANVAEVLNEKFHLDDEISMESLSKFAT